LHERVRRHQEWRKEVNVFWETKDSNG
jgi:hypothetical protein